jgi:cephalosporin hydroxylase
MWISSEQALIWQSGIKNISGWTWRADLQTLFELAYYSPGDVLEIGYNCGRSTVAIAMGLREANDQERELVTLDHMRCPEVVRRHLKRIYPPKLTSVIRMESTKFLKKDKRQYGFVFVDGGHRTEQVTAELKLLHSKIVRGGFLACHDCYTHRDNPNPLESQKRVIGWVQAAVKQSISDDDWAFWGRYGACGVWLRRTDPQEV